MTGAEFRSLREALGWTQLEMALFVHVSPATVYTWEAFGYKPVRFTYLEKVGLVTLFEPIIPRLDSVLLDGLRNDIRQA